MSVTGSLLSLLASTAPAPAGFADALKPLLPDLSVGALLGFATGVALKHIGRWALVGLGVLFITVQVLAYFDLVSVNWLRVQALAEPWLAQGRENGGAWLTRLLTANLPFAILFFLRLHSLSCKNLA